METVPLWWWVVEEPSSPLLMEPLGLKELLEFQTQNLFIVSPTEMVLSWGWVVEEPSSLLLMETLGLEELLEHQTKSEESPTEMVPS